MGLMAKRRAAADTQLSNESWDVVLTLLRSKGHRLGPILLDGRGRYALVDLDGNLRHLPQVLWIALPYMTAEWPKQ